MTDSENKLENFKEEFPMFLDMVYDYNQNLILFGSIDDINHLKKCREFYERHIDAMPKNEISKDFSTWITEITKCNVSLWHSWHPRSHGHRISAMFVKEVILKNV